MSLPDIAAQISRSPYVSASLADRTVHAFADSGNITLIRADKVWSTFANARKGVTVAIIDTGIDYNHPALGAGFGPGFKVIGGLGLRNDDADPAFTITATARTSPESWPAVGPSPPAWRPRCR